MKKTYLQPSVKCTGLDLETVVCLSDATPGQPGEAGSAFDSEKNIFSYDGLF